MLIINNHKTGIENIEISWKMWAIGHDRGMNSNNNKKKKFETKQNDSNGRPSDFRARML